MSAKFVGVLGFSRLCLAGLVWQARNYWHRAKPVASSRSTHGICGHTQGCQPLWLYAALTNCQTHVAFCRGAQDNGEYAKAFWLCAECCKSMEDVASLKVAQHLNSTINQLYEETIQRLEGALQSVCNDFHADQYVKVRHCMHLLCRGHVVPFDIIHQRAPRLRTLSCLPPCRLHTCPTCTHAILALCNTAKQWMNHMVICEASYALGFTMVTPACTQSCAHTQGLHQPGKTQTTVQPSST